MPVRKEYTVEFKEQAVRYVFDEIGPDESRSAAVERLASRYNVEPATLMNWVKAVAPARPPPTPLPGSVDELRAQVAALKKENRELARANAILQDAASFFGVGARPPVKAVAAFVAVYPRHGVEPTCRVLHVAWSAVGPRSLAARRRASSRMRR